MKKLSSMVFGGLFGLANFGCPPQPIPPTTQEVPTLIEELLNVDEEETVPSTTQPTQPPVSEPVVDEGPKKPEPLERGECMPEHPTLYFEDYYLGLGGLREGTYHRNFNDCPGYVGGSQSAHCGTVEMRSRDGGIKLLWSFGGLNHIFLNKNWLGETNRGIKMGSSIEEYREKYRIDFECTQETDYTTLATMYKDDPSERLIARFDKDEKLVGLLIADGFLCRMGYEEDKPNCFKASFLKSWANVAEVGD